MGEPKRALANCAIAKIAVAAKVFVAILQGRHLSHSCAWAGHIVVDIAAWNGAKGEFCCSRWLNLRLAAQLRAIPNLIAAAPNKWNGGWLRCSKGGLCSVIGVVALYCIGVVLIVGNLLFAATCNYKGYYC